jgi:hypothetical protein
MFTNKEVYTRVSSLSGLGADGVVLFIRSIPPSPEEPTGEEGKRWRESTDLSTAQTVVGLLREVLTPRAQQLIAQGLEERKRR